MKIVCVLLFSFLAVALAGRADDNAKISKYLEECRKDFGVDKKTSKEIEESMTAYQNACFSFCMEKKRGMMNEDGTYNKAAILNFDYDPPSLKAKFEKVIENCEKKVKPIDGCKLAACLHGAEV